MEIKTVGIDLAKNVFQILADLPRLHRESKKFGRIDIHDGTKGGRSGVDFGAEMGCG